MTRPRKVLILVSAYPRSINASSITKRALLSIQLLPVENSLNYKGESVQISDCASNPLVNMPEQHGACSKFTRKKMQIAAFNVANE